VTFGAQTGWALYLGMGMVATVNPCGFAMLPAYLSYFLGVESEAPDSAQAGYREALRVTAAVSAGFLAVFAVAGMVVELVDSAVVYENMPWVSIIIGLALVVLGVAMLGGYELVTRLPKLDRGGRTRSVRSMFVFGVSYAIASIGCTLPMFLTAVSGTIRRESVLDGLAVFGVYALGMAIVLSALTVAIAMTRTGIVHVLRRAQPYVGRVAGGLVALAGAYVALYGVGELRKYRDPGADDSAVTDRVTGWSYDITTWVNDVGPVRLAAVLVTAVALLGAALWYGRRDDRPGQGARRRSRQPAGDVASRS
jgi:cytochrome c-type biogenesis protein